MFCPKCGKQIEGMPMICPECNQNISEDVQMLMKSENAATNPVEEMPAAEVNNTVPDQQFVNTQFNNPNQFNNGWVPPAPPAAPRPLRTGILKPVISVLLALVFLTTSVFATVVTDIDVSKATDKTTNAIIESEEDEATDSDAPKYDASKITKPPVETTELDSLVADSAGAANTRNEIAVIEEKITAAESELAETYTEITLDNFDYYISKISNVAWDMYSENLIVEYETNSDNVIFKLNGGGYYVYSPHIAGYDSGDAPEVKVSTYQPMAGKGQYASGYESYASYADDSASALANVFDTYNFKNDGTATDYNFDNEEVDPFKVAKLGEYGVALWHGHGVYSYEHGPLLFLGVQRTPELDAQYYSLIKDGTIILSEDSYAIGAAFVDKYVPDGSMKNTVLYLGACSSGYSEKLAEAFLNKGAEAVYGATNIINTGYDASMMKSIAKALGTQKSDGTFYTASEALEYAKSENGEYDSAGNYNAQIKLFAKNKSSDSYYNITNDSTYSLDWYKDCVVCDKDIVLLLDVSGSMDGEPLSETKKASVEFINTVLDDSARISLITFATDAEVVNEFSARNSALISNINNLRTRGSTNMDDGIQKAEELFDRSSAKKKVLVLMSDGYPNEDRVGDELINYARTVRDKGVDIYTLGFFHGMGASSRAEAQKLLKAIASDGMNYEVSSSDDLLPFFSDIAANIGGQKYIYVEIACPVDVTVTKDGETLCSKENDRSTHSSFGTLSFEQLEDDDYTDDESNQKKVLRLKDGVEYDIKIEGNGDGSMDYTIRYMDENGKYTDSREFSNIKISGETVVDTVASSMRDKTVLSVDDDGDGRAETVYEAKANSKGKEVDDTLHKIFFYLDFVFGAWLIASAIFLAIRINNRKKVSAEKAKSTAEETAEA